MDGIDDTTFRVVTINPPNNSTLISSFPCRGLYTIASLSRGEVRAKKWAGGSTEVLNGDTESDCSPLLHRENFRRSPARTLSERLTPPPPNETALAQTSSVD
jgi:hypothetical protein